MGKEEIIIVPVAVVTVQLVHRMSDLISYGYIYPITWKILDQRTNEAE